MVVDLDTLINNRHGERVKLPHGIEALLGLVEGKVERLLGVVGNLKGHLIHGVAHFLVML